MSLSSIAETRRSLLKRVLPSGLPPLWCPPITHYTESGAIDRPRTEAHLEQIAPYVKGLLASGSTGDGWELDDERQRQVIQLSIQSAAKFQQQVLVGVLRPTAEETSKDLASMARTLSGTYSAVAAVNRLAGIHVIGFTVCPPSGGPMPLGVVGAGLELILSHGVPVSLYQLPQVTGYEMPAEFVTTVAAHHANFLYFKDSSGHDLVAKARRPPAGIYLMRGAEGEYSRWLTLGGGPYHSLLLSSANCFGSEQAKILEDLRNHRKDEARTRSEALSALITELFAAVGKLPHGNPFSNANKAADHFMAHGASALSKTPPKYSNGEPLPKETLSHIGEILKKHGRLPETGYLK